MNKTFWNSVAEEFEDEIFNTLTGGRTPVIQQQIDRYKDKDAVAADLGCGTGRYLPTLSDGFKLVHAIDFSDKCLDVARKAYPKLENVVYAQHDLGRDTVRLRGVSFTICVNTLIMGSAKTRENIWANLSRCVMKGGHLLVVVPSIESALLSHFRVVDWNARSGENHTRQGFKRFPANGGKKYSFRDGVLDIETLPTKHFLEEELIVTLDRMGFKTLHIDKVEYPWASEITSPPRWMKEPYPWDWLVVGQRV
jgi:SAM-dependent methyltransferase